MNLKSLFFGGVLGFLVAVIPSCGATQAVCGPVNCAGCCDAAGACVPKTASNSNTACGTQGNTCVNCTAKTQTCNPTSFMCEGGTAVTGGGTALTGGGSASTGGGSTSTGGGSSSAGGGTATAGGGTASAGGGTTSTGGGTSATGGGSVSTGGGAAMGGGIAGCNIQTAICAAGTECLVTDVQQPSMAQCLPGCRLTDPTSCAAGTKCAYSNTGARVCIPSTGTATATQTCAMETDCAPGHACLNTGADGGLACTKFCNGTVACTMGQVCANVLELQGLPEKPLFCATVAGCNPLIQLCPAGQGCYPVSQTAFTCVAAGQIPTGAVCPAQPSSPATLCIPGNLCAGAQGGASTCRPVCNLDGGTPSCAAGACQMTGTAIGVCG